MKITIKNKIMLLVFIYLISNFLLLSNYCFIYWDDWAVIGRSFLSLYKQGKEVGAPIWWSAGHYYLYQYFGVLGFRFLTFIFYLGASILFYLTLRKIKSISESEALLLSLFFIVLPLNTTRILVITIVQKISYFFFFAGLYSFLNVLEKRSKLWRFSALICFWLSFYVNSVLTFYLLIFIIFIYYVLNNLLPFSKKSILLFFKEILKYFDFWILPIAFWLAKIFLSPTSGRFAHYNKLKYQKVIDAFGVSIVGGMETFYRMFLEISNIPLWLVMVIVVVISVFLFSLSKEESINSGSTKRILILLAIGIIMSYIAIFPYAAVGKILGNSFDDWQGRTQFLLPIGFSLIIVYFFKLLRLRSKVINVILYSLISLFVLVNNIHFFNYLIDGIKQDAIIELFKRSDIIQNNRTVLIVDKCHELNVNNRNYRFYELSGMAANALGKETKLVLEKDYGTRRLKRYGTDYFLRFTGEDSDRFRLSNYKYAKPTFCLILENGNYDLSKLYIKIEAIYYLYTDKIKYNKFLEQLFKLKAKKLTKNELVDLGFSKS